MSNLSMPNSKSIFAIICQVTMNAFPQWLADQLQEKGWIPADLARIARVDNGVISRILSGERKATPDTLVSIASALKISPEDIFRRAGLLPNSNISERAARLAFRIGQLPAEDQEILDAMIDGLVQKRGKKSEIRADLPEDGTVRQT
jgi:transcriptional regulator with XRE-family HTH domain